MARPVTETEVDNFLENKLNIQIATVDRKGCPTIQPLWFLYERDSGKIYVGTQKTTKKIQNIQRNPDKIYFSIDDEKYPYRGVKGKAIARISEDIQQNLSSIWVLLNIL
jgi:uncharacterized pyridoxamine 5'-phosphate oxidase family protein